MAAPWTKGFYTSKAWRRNARAYLESVDGLCERCRAEGRLIPAVIVHHRIHLTPENIKDPKYSMSWNNLEALCQDCHNKEHHANQAGPSRYAFAADGSLLT